MEVNKNTLRIEGICGAEMRDLLEELLNGLEHSEFGEIVVDLAKTSNITSVCVSAILMSHLNLANHGKKMIVVANEEINKQLTFAMLDKVLTIQVV